MDLLDVNGILRAMIAINYFVHEAVVNMNEEVHCELPLVRSRSASISSSEVSIPHEERDITQ